MHIGNSNKRLNDLPETPPSWEEEIQIASAEEIYAVAKKSLTPRSEKKNRAHKKRRISIDSLDLLPDDLILLICKPLGMTSLRLAAVNTRMYFLFQTKMKHLNIGYQALLKIIQLAPCEEIGTPIFQALPSAVLMLAQACHQNDWMERLHALCPLNRHVLSPEQFEKMIESNMPAAISYINLLVSLQPKSFYIHADFTGQLNEMIASDLPITMPMFDCYDNAFKFYNHGNLVEISSWKLYSFNGNNFYHNYIRALFSLLEKLLPYAEKIHCQRWISEILQDWGIEEFAYIDIKELPSHVRALARSKTRNPESWLKACFSTLYPERFQKYPELFFHIMEAMSGCGIAINNEIYLLADISNYNVAIPEDMIDAVYDFYERYEVLCEYLLGGEACGWSLLAFTAKWDYHKALKIAFDVSEHAKESTCAGLLSAYRLAEYAWESPENLEAALKLISLSRAEAYFGGHKEDPLLPVLATIEKKLEQGALTPQKALPLMQRIDQFKLLEDNEELWQEDWDVLECNDPHRVDEYTYLSIIGSLFHFFAFHDQDYARVFCMDHMDDIERILNSELDEVRLKCLKALLHIDLNSIHIIVEKHDVKSIFGEIIALVFDKNRSLALEISLRFKYDNRDAMLEILQYIASRLDHSNFEERQMALGILNLLEPREKDSILKIFSSNIATGDFSLACQTASQISNEELRCAAYLEIYCKMPFLAHAQLEKNSEAVLKTIEFANNSSESLLATLKLYSCVDLKQFFKPIDDFLLQENISFAELNELSEKLLLPIFENWNFFGENETLAFEFFNKLDSLAAKIDFLKSHLVLKVFMLQWLRENSPHI